MIKLKLTRDELQCICWLCNPIYVDGQVLLCVKTNNFDTLNDLFSLIEIGEKAAKKFLFDHKKSYKLNITYAQAAAFYNHADWNELTLSDQYKQLLITRIKSEIHLAFTNYQRQYYARTN